MIKSRKGRLWHCQWNKRVPKILFILFVVAFCVYLVPRVAINFFYYPDDKIYGPDPGRLGIRRIYG